MASISTDAKGNRKIHFVNGDGKRKTVYVGKITKADAKEICSKEEAILAVHLSRRSLAPEVADWVADVPDVLAEKLWDQAAEGAEHVITRYRDCNANLRTQLLRIIDKAGVTARPKLSKIFGALVRLN